MNWAHSSLAWTNQGPFVLVKTIVENYNNCQVPLYNTSASKSLRRSIYGYFS